VEIEEEGSPGSGLVLRHTGYDRDMDLRIPGDGNTDERYGEAHYQ